jgi:GIY-YIG catalytic domain
MCPWFDPWRYHKTHSNEWVFVFILFMAQFLYILHSESTPKFYVGETHAIEERILKYIQHLYSNFFTKIVNDWNCIFLSGFLVCKLVYIRSKPLHIITIWYRSVRVCFAFFLKYIYYFLGTILRISMVECSVFLSIFE